MGDVLSPFTISSPPPPSTKNNSMPMLYYGLVVVGTAAIVLAIYNLVLLKRSQGRSAGLNPNPNPNGLGLIEGMSLENQQRHLLSSFKYKKEVVVGEEEQEDFECPVCLSVYEEGEEVRKLPQCKHYFHVLCIDMWLYSHFDCPICRTPVAGTSFPVDNSSPDRFMESGRISIY